MALRCRHLLDAVLPFDGFDLYRNQRPDLLLAIGLERLAQNSAMVVGTGAGWCSFSPVGILLL